MWLPPFGVVFGFSLHLMPQISAPEAGVPDLMVVGHQWWWEVRYPDDGIVTANELHIPVGKRMLVQLQSADVIHSFWVPQLNGKMDAIPGHTRTLWLQADSARTLRTSPAAASWPEDVLRVRPATSCVG